MSSLIIKIRTRNGYRKGHGFYFVHFMIISLLYPRRRFGLFHKCSSLAAARRHSPPVLGPSCPAPFFLHTVQPPLPQSTSELLSLGHIFSYNFRHPNIWHSSIAFTWALTLSNLSAFQHLTFYRRFPHDYNMVITVVFLTSDILST